MAARQFEDIVRQIIANSFSSLLSQERQAQITEIGKSWDYYYGMQEQYIKQYRGEADDDYRDKDKMTFNYTKGVVDEYIEGVMAKPVTVKFEKEVHQKMWTKIVDPLTFFNILPFFVKVQRVAEVSNTCVVMLRWNKEQKQVYFESVRGEFVSFLPDPNNPQEVGTVIISYIFDTGEADPQKRFLKRIEIWDKSRWEVWLYSPTLRDSKKIAAGVNPYPFIPAVRFMPEEDDNTFYGISHVPDIVKVNGVYNNLWTALIRTCVMQSFSILVLTSEGEIEVKIAPTRFLKFEGSESGDAKYITPDPKISDVRTVLENLKSELQDFSKVPTEVLSSSSAEFPQSGYALRIKRIPIEQVWEKRRMSYGPSLRDLTRKAVIVDSVNRNESIEEEIKVDVEFSKTVPGLSPQEQAIQDQQDLQFHLITPVDLMLRKHPEMTREEALKKIEENKKEAEKLGVDKINPVDRRNLDADRLRQQMNRKKNKKKEIEDG